MGPESFRWNDIIRESVPETYLDLAGDVKKAITERENKCEKISRHMAGDLILGLKRDHDAALFLPFRDCPTATIQQAPGNSYWDH